MQRASAAAARFLAIGSHPERVLVAFAQFRPFATILVHIGAVTAGTAGRRRILITIGRHGDGTTGQHAFRFHTHRALGRVRFGAIAGAARFRTVRCHPQRVRLAFTGGRPETALVILVFAVFLRWLRFWSDWRRLRGLLNLRSCIRRLSCWYWLRNCWFDRRLGRGYIWGSGGPWRSRSSWCRGTCR